VLLLLLQEKGLEQVPCLLKTHCHHHLSPLTGP
jgi:hypothetical protein